MDEKISKIYSTEIVQKFEQHVPISFDRIILITIVIIMIVTMVESVSSIYKAIKYGGRD